MSDPQAVPTGRPGRAQGARVLSFLFLGGAILGLLTVAVLPLPPDTNVPGTLATLGVALVLSAGLRLGAERIPGWALALALAAGTIVVSFDVYFAGDIRTNDEMFYLWVAFFAFYFLPVRVAAGQIAVLGAAYAAALAARGEPDAPTRWIVTLGTLTIAGVLISRLVSQMQRWAEHSSEREAQLVQAEERFRSAFDDAAIGMALADLQGRWTRVNQALAQLLGYSTGQLLKMSFRELTDPEDLESDVEALEDMVAGRKQSYHTEKRYLHADGHTVWVVLSVSVVRNSAGEPVYLISQIQDISERKAAEQELTARALQDPLTGLPNRLLFMDRVEVALARMQRPGSSLAVFFLDLDRFKLMNDSLGHAAGDRLLVAVAERVRNLLRPSDTVSRFGGDEFTILCENTDERAASRVAERIAEKLSEPFFADGHELFVNASIGIAVGRTPTDEAEGLLRDADAAMYRAKQQGRSRYTLFDGGMRPRGTERLELENDLRKAIDRGELRLYYQPEIILDSGRVFGVEALVRWEHPRHGLMPPSAFIPVAEDSGLIFPLGEWVLREACQQAAAWRSGLANAGALGLAVNLSPRQLAEEELCELVRHALESSGLEPSALCLEITETAAVDAGTSTLTRLKELGVRLALDDFGVGFSSLNHIRRLPPVDIIKIDECFVDDLGRAASDTAVVAAIIGMARSLGIATIAEGIETASQAQRLQELGCERGQGSYFARPSPSSGIAELLGSASLGELAP